jgi:hypothetical protein
MQAHGCDVRNALGGVKTLNVPENCVYVTLAVCGKSKLIDHIYKKILELIETNHFSIKDPVRYKTTIEELIKSPIHVHHPDATDKFLKTYVDNTYFPWFAWQCNESGYVDTGDVSHVKMLTSGLYKSDTLMSLNDLPDDIPQQMTPNFNYIITKDNTITEEMIRIIYKNSITPTADTIISNLQKYKKSTYSFSDLYYASGTITQSKLFEQHPGIYYNIVCRGPCEKNQLYDYLFHPYELRRQQSEIADQGYPTITNSFLTTRPFRLEKRNKSLEILKSLRNFGIDILNDVHKKEASIDWEGPVNLIGCNLDDAIKIKRQPNYIDIDVDYKTYPGLAGNCTIHIYYDVFKKNQDYDIDEIRSTIEKNHYTFVSFKDDELIMTKYFKDAYDDLFVDDSTSWLGLGGKTKRRKLKRRKSKKLKQKNKCYT